MSIGIFDLNTGKPHKLGFALLCCASLSACNEQGGAGFPFAPKEVGGATSNASSARPHTSKTTLARGAITLKAPRGYCIDETSVKNGLQGSFALLATCSSLAGKGSRGDTAVMSVQISARRGDDAVTPTSQDLANAAAPRKILQRQQKGDLALVKIASGGDDVFSPADPVHWRAATSLDTRLVLFGLFAPSGSELTSNKGAELLASLARGISATKGPFLGFNSPQQSEASENTQAKSLESTPLKATESGEAPKKSGEGFIGRLLNRL